MFGKKLILISAAVALAVGNVASLNAVEEATRISVKIANHARNHHHVKQEGNDTLVPEGDVDIDIDVYESGSGSGSWTEEPTEEEGSTAEDPAEEEGSTAEEPTEEEGSGEEEPTEEGSNEEDPTYGEYPEGEGEGDDEVTVECDGDDASPMSVEGVEGVFCVAGQACVADILGACPGPQDGLEYGSYCGTVATGVYGCKPYTEEPVCSGEDESPMSVEGVEGIFCVSGDACAGDIEGACPEAQDGLEYGSYCGIVDTGVYGCKPNDAKHHKKGHFGKKPAHFKPTHFKKAAHKKPVVKKPVVKKVAVKKVAVKKVVQHKKPAVQVKKVVHAKKVEAKKPVVKKPAVKKVVVKKVAAKKPAAHKKVEVKKVAHKKVDHKKAEHKH